MTQEARLPRGWIRGTTLIVTGLLLACALIALTNAGSISADDPWPTPPPGPRPSVPKVIVDDGIKPVDTPLVAGATKWVVLPLAMLLPRFPPVPSSSFQAPDDVRIVSDAGSIDSTIQLVYEPIPAADAQPPGPHQSLRKAFDLRTFDHQANRITLDLRRP